MDDKLYVADKGMKDVEASPLRQHDAESVKAAEMAEYNNMSIWTRLGVTPESFKQRTSADKTNQVNQSLRSRHLHMIAIGGSIGGRLNELCSQPELTTLRSWPICRFWICLEH